MATARRLLVKDDVESTYHCISRCVRRAYLCGIDSYSGVNYEHRKKWVEGRLQLLSGIFSIDICGFAVMSNHLHVILRSRPDVSGHWEEKTLLRRWWSLFPKRRDASYRASEPSESDLRGIITGRPMSMTPAGWKKELRRRLTSISWFMRCLNENIARRANREDMCKGRFWEGRFKCQLLTSEAAILACSAYVDLNPIRSGLCKTPEKSAYTSIYRRIESLLSKGELEQYENRRLTPKEEERSRRIIARSESADWLCPIGIDSARVRRNSRYKPLFSQVSLWEYIDLVDYTGRRIRQDKRGAIPKSLAPILSRLGLDGSQWHETVSSFGRLFFHVVGRSDELQARADASDQRWLKGTNACKAAFG